jgi:hypothetical protein
MLKYTHVDKDPWHWEHSCRWRLLRHVTVELLVTFVPLDGVEKGTFQVVIARELYIAAPPHCLGDFDLQITQAQGT